MFSLKGKIALITGASGGIGTAIATALHAQGATVVLSGTREPALNEIASKLNSGAPVHVLSCDLSNMSDCQQLFARTESQYGAVDVLVNNAGITSDSLSIMMKDEDWNKVINVNLTAPFFLARAALKSMLKRKAGRIINITSIVGHNGNPGQANYVAAKAGLTGMSKSLAQEVASRGITINNVAPGFIETPMTEKLNEQQKEKIVKNIPVGRIGKPEDVAACVAFLASDEASYINGHTIHVNGGMLMV